MINANDLIAKFLYALENIWGYIWGQWGAMWTAAKQRQKVNYMISKYGTGWKSNSEAKQDNYYQAALNGDRWIGHNVADCSGLFRWAFDQLGGAISHSSNRIWLSYCTKKGELSKGLREDGTEPIPGTAVFVHPTGNSKRTHIGLYIGNGVVIEAASTVKGVIKSNITDRKWVELGELKGIDYSDVPQPEPGPDPEPAPTPAKHSTLRKGDKGPEVRLMQTELLACGEQLPKYGADGSFGNETLAAVRSFQKKHPPLVVDGICGPLTWAELDKYSEGSGA
jgi:hypothetical protein